jgi:hypothetical protein
MNTNSQGNPDATMNQPTDGAVAKPVNPNCARPKGNGESWLTKGRHQPTHGRKRRLAFERDREFVPRQRNLKLLNLGLAN